MYILTEHLLQVTEWVGVPTDVRILQVVGLLNVDIVVRLRETRDEQVPYTVDCCIITYP